MLVKEVVRKNYKAASAEEKVKARELMEKMRKEEEKLIRGRFEFIDARGGWLDFNYRKYPGDPILFLKIMHGEVCDMPLGIVRHLRSCQHKVRKNEWSSDGLLQLKEVSSRIAFTPEY